MIKNIQKIKINRIYFREIEPGYVIIKIFYTLKHRVLGGFDENSARLLLT